VLQHVSATILGYGPRAGRLHLGGVADGARFVLRPLADSDDVAFDLGDETSGLVGKLGEKAVKDGLRFGDLAEGFDVVGLPPSDSNIDISPRLFREESVEAPLYRAAAALSISGEAQALG